MPVGHQQRKQSSDKTLKSPARGKFELNGSSAMSNLECEAQPDPQVTTSATSMSPQLCRPSTQGSGSSWHGKARALHAEKSRAGQLATQLLATRRNWYKEKLLKSLRWIIQHFFDLWVLTTAECESCHVASILKWSTNGCDSDSKYLKLESNLRYIVYAAISKTW